MNWQSTFRSPPDARQLPGLRRQVQSYLLEQGTNENVVESAGLVISELTHNAMEASAQDAREILVHVATSDENVKLAVECAANQDLTGLSRALEDSCNLPSPDSERGRGLWLIMAYSDELSVDQVEGGAIRITVTFQTDSAR